MSRRTGGWLVALFVGVALAALLSLIHLPYAILKPGPVTNTLGNVRREHAADPASATPAPTRPPARSTSPPWPSTAARSTPSTSGTSSPGWSTAAATSCPSRRCSPRARPASRSQEENAAEMADSQQEAIAVALRATGTKVPEVISIAQVPDGSPSKGVPAGRRRGRERRRRAGRQHRGGARRGPEAQPGGDGGDHGAPGRGHQGARRHAPAAADGQDGPRRAAAHPVRLPGQGHHQRRGRRRPVRGADVLARHLRQADAREP